jgi:hypothetical protein
VPGGGDGQKFSEAFYDGNDDRLDGSHVVLVDKANEKCDVYSIAFLMY